MFDVTFDDDARRGAVNTPVTRTRAAARERLSVNHKSVVIDPQRLLLGSSTSRERLLLCELAGAEPTLRWLNLPAPLGGSPVALGGGVVAAGDIGQIFWLDVNSGSSLATPFETTLATGRKHQWQLATTGSQDGSGRDALIVADETAMLYRVGVEDGSPPALAAHVEREIAAPIARGFAVTGTSAFAVDRDNRLIVVNSMTLEETLSHDLEAACVWGPTVVGNLVLLATDDGPMFAFTSDGETAWTQTPGPGRLVGAAARDDANIVLAFSDGRLRVASSDRGEAVAEVELGRPLSRGPVIWQGRAVCAAPNGVLYAVELP